MRLLAFIFAMFAAPALAQPSLDEALAPFTAEFAGVIRVERGGEPTFERAYGFASWELDIPNRVDTRFKLHSLSKPLTAALIHRAADQERLNLEAPICLYLTPCPDAWSLIRVRHLLNHSAGLPELTGALASGWEGDLASSLAAVIETGETGLTGIPGGQFRYSNFGYVLLARIAETVYGAPFDEVMAAHLFAPAGMDGAGVETPPAPGGYDGPLAVKALASGYNGSADTPQRALSKMYVIPGAGGVYATAEDLGDFADALFQGRLMTPKMVDAMATPSASLDTAYAYGLVTTDSNGLLIHRHDGGNNGYLAWLARYPDHDVTLVILSNQGFAPINDMRQAIEAALFGPAG